ncbi:hypothetical protein SARC_03743 [Sphaeroforma arctica JP610]|uniref:Uncharacterized protein n=1 Tax=Sphaeroforma arctica JP610 TaxID=667725 RepID=A0A0L0G730_9EUKA|nr:hypothetical protein SARC_03743 [Sphaeroforma arctica JP610]KNC84033.1 hypothetical protein SARC_03743 [Sphaeroforma arctica JP610]|eukprot:XP_014157935.1 hypothetical protein SARC_03743 [Sphaeroforma arctica JP610]
MYDKGLTDRYELEMNDVCVITPRKKQNNQIVFERRRMVADRNVARERCNIERTMEELENYSAFDTEQRYITASELVLADKEAQCVRGFVNFKPRSHNWLISMTRRDKDLEKCFGVNRVTSTDGTAVDNVGGIDSMVEF